MKGKILLIDDNPTDLKVASALLERAGYACECKTNGKQALQWLQTNSCTLILLDIQLPEISGFELLTLIRKNPTSLRTPIIMMSGRNQAEDVKKAIGLGAKDYIIKPIDLLILQEKVDKLTQSFQDEFSGVPLAAGTLPPVQLSQEAQITQLSEFGLSIESSKQVSPTETVELSGLTQEIFGKDRVLLRCLNSSKDPTRPIYKMQFTFIGISETQRQLLRKACRNLWIQLKGEAA